MKWTGTALSRDECEALRRTFPSFRVFLEFLGRERFTVQDYLDWLARNNHHGVVGMTSSQKKGEVAEGNPGMEVLDVQNALHHLSACDPECVITDGGDEPIQLVRKVGDTEYEVIPD